ncbi:MAG: hypothetical protein LKG79_07940 [Furfurilactobacillus sp.]|jgi:hypothetical protein|uniref:Uncharacterized protein n=2 Tax=Furfurilactobacillus TaxID=2767882 RepID=A0A6N9I4F2_9LACO|nr:MULTISPECIES: hypothetical protein [Furfurilactobacillus]QLE65683.1 hypothetical protein LROSL2_0330 [Furfurilactobacillus rossiae]MCF6161837.1 hypothetical protein [Furfurilactobacillus milii]MCF6164217.1 hypothetical protein [Furfurilactobacillus milii]MCF6420040.1 hypothetical protein [Furfurilactobacillus milii]MCH4012210.1 hypothetical protein [Furfurilactobacillus sp.]
MSQEIPENMHEVVLKVQELNETRHGADVVTEEEVMKDAVHDTLQYWADYLLDGHYDDVLWDGEDLVIEDIMGKRVGRVKPMSATFANDYRQSPEGTLFRLENEANKIIAQR